MVNPMFPTILYRQGPDTMDEVELKAAKNHFVAYNSRMKITGRELIIGRYSVLPFYKELEDDVKSVGSALINSYSQHRYVADLQNYVADLQELTFRTWNARDLYVVPDNIPLVLKGETNSKKHLWKTHMFAANKQEAVDVFLRLNQDNMIGQQEIFVREYIPLKKLLDGVGGQPITLEYRFFVAYGEVVSGGFYWSSYIDDLPPIPSPTIVPQAFLRSAIDRVKDKVNFFVLDVGQTESGEWIVIELNDGQMSGLSENDPEILYKNLKQITASHCDIQTGSYR
jgi:hypothetical protein